MRGPSEMNQIYCPLCLAKSNPMTGASFHFSCHHGFCRSCVDRGPEFDACPLPWCRAPCTTQGHSSPMRRDILAHPIIAGKWVATCPIHDNCEAGVLLNSQSPLKPGPRCGIEINPKLKGLFVEIKILQCRIRPSMNSLTRGYSALQKILNQSGLALAFQESLNLVMGLLLEEFIESKASKLLSQPMVFKLRLEKNYGYGIVSREVEYLAYLMEGLAKAATPSKVEALVRKLQELISDVLGESVGTCDFRKAFVPKSEVEISGEGHLIDKFVRISLPESTKTIKSLFINFFGHHSACSSKGVLKVTLASSTRLRSTRRQVIHVRYQRTKHRLRIALRESRAFELRYLDFFVLLFPRLRWINLVHRIDGPEEESAALFKTHAAHRSDTFVIAKDKDVVFGCFWDLPWQYSGPMRDSASFLFRLPECRYMVIRDEIEPWNQLLMRQQGPLIGGRPYAS